MVYSYPAKVVQLLGGADKRRVEALIRAAEARIADRPVLRGEALPGNAWENYDLALAEVRKITSRAPISDLVNRNARADIPVVRKILETHGAVIDQMRRGTRRAVGQVPFEWERRGDEYRSQFTMILAQLAVCRARLDLQDGRARAASDLLLDLCQFARDLGHNSSHTSAMISMFIYWLAFEDLRDALRPGRLSPQDLREIDRELALIDRIFPDVQASILNDTADVGRRFLRGELLIMKSDFSGLESCPPTWRYLWSGPLMAADTFEFQDRMALRDAGAEALSWGEEQRIMTESEAERGRSANPIVQAWSKTRVAFSASTPSCTFRDGRARLRLLRIATRFLACDEVLDLDDPFGSKLRHEAAGSRLKAWSVGADGRDDGGAGDWARNAKDLVLEVGPPSPPNPR